MALGKMYKYVKKSDVKNQKKSVIKSVKRLLDNQIEDKQAGTNLSLISDNIFQYSLINGIDQGAAQGQRTGTRIKSKYIDWYVSATQAGTGTTPQSIRIVMFIDRQPNGAAPTTAQLIVNTTAGQQFISPFNINGKERYKVLLDRIYYLERMGGATDTRVQKSYKGRINLRKYMSIYNGSGTTVASINTGAIYFGYVGDVASGANASVDIDGNISLIYEDA